MGIEPGEEDLPTDLMELSEESQLAFDIYRYLSERWDGMSGTYLGKDYNILPFLFEHYKIEGEEASHILIIIQYIDSIVMKRMNEKRQQETQLKEAQSKWQNA
jgi:hypothetical protein